MNTIKESNAIAKATADNKKYRYLYGAKDQKYTKALVEQLAKAQPSTYTASLKKLALQDADKGYMAIDCSGFVCKCLGIANQGSSALKSSAYKTYTVAKSNAKEGMALWKNGHIAYVGADLKIYEANCTAIDMKVSTWEQRASAFTHLIVVKGSALEKQMKESASKTTTTTTTTTKTSSSHKVGDKVTFSGILYSNANGSGNSVRKTNAEMYISDISNGSKYPYGLASKKGASRVGWGKL